MKKIGRFTLKTPDGIDEVSRVVYQENVGEVDTDTGIPMQEVRRFCYWQNGKWEVDGTRSVVKTEPKITEKITSF